MSILTYPDPVTLRALDERYVESFLIAGESSLPRHNASTATALVSGTMTLTYFRGKRTQALTNVRTLTAATAAAATPTLCRVGVYGEATNGDITLLAAIANDTTLWATVQTSYTRALTSTWNEVLGQRYALGVLIVSGAAPPALYGVFHTNAATIGTILSATPRLYGAVSGQTDLPSSVATASILTNNGPRMVLGEFT